MHAFCFSVPHNFLSKYRKLSYLLQHIAQAFAVQAHLVAIPVFLSSFFHIVLLNAICLL